MVLHVPGAVNLKEPLAEQVQLRGLPFAEQHGGPASTAFSPCRGPIKPLGVIQAGVDAPGLLAVRRLVQSSCHGWAVGKKVIRLPCSRVAR